ncbi:uncharacterized protein LOC106670651 [Cimex lectularius]|uniref:Uncharacterized protein n=1 Tax=Cimex lectularius TaxID=79782 RepID=A0A8I6S3V1_CIMLE|nr:uncharacterized protein LOC106670651 [Cimex lectularius]
MKYDSVNIEDQSSSKQDKKSIKSRHHLRISQDNILDFNQKPTGVENIEGTSSSKKKRKKEKKDKKAKDLDMLLVNPDILNEENDQGKNKEEVIMEIRELEMKAKAIRAILKKDGHAEEVGPKTKKIKLATSKDGNLTYLT